MLGRAGVWKSALSGGLPSQAGLQGLTELVSDGNTTHWNTTQNYSSVFDECCYGFEVSGPMGPFGIYQGGNAGGSPVNTINAAVALNNMTNRFGLAAIGTGTTSNNTAGAYLASDYTQIYAGQVGTSVLQFAFFTPTVATSTNDFTIELGWRNSINSGNGPNSAAFIYNSASVNWQAYTANNSSTTFQTTGSSAFVYNSSTWCNFQIVMTAAQVQFNMANPGSAYQNLATISTNLPSAAHPTYMGFMLYRNSTFALQRLMVFDWIKHDCFFSGSR